MARAGYCRHGTYIHGGGSCYQCQAEENKRKEAEQREKEWFERRVREIVERVLEERKS